MVISDRIAVLQGGRVVQVGTAEELFHQPRTRFVAEFIGTSSTPSPSRPTRSRAAAFGSASHRPASSQAPAWPCRSARTRSRWSSGRQRRPAREPTPTRERCGAPASWATAWTTRSRSPTAPSSCAWRRPAPGAFARAGRRPQDRPGRLHPAGRRGRPGMTPSRPSRPRRHAGREADASGRSPGRPGPGDRRIEVSPRVLPSPRGTARAGGSALPPLAAGSVGASSAASREAAAPVG